MQERETPTEILGPLGTHVLYEWFALPEPERGPVPVQRGGGVAGGQGQAAPLGFARECLGIHPGPVIVRKQVTTLAAKDQARLPDRVTGPAHQYGEVCLGVRRAPLGQRASISTSLGISRPRSISRICRSCRARRPPKEPRPTSCLARVSRKQPSRRTSTEFWPCPSRDSPQRPGRASVPGTAGPRPSGPPQSCCAVVSGWSAVSAKDRSAAARCSRSRTAEGHLAALRQARPGVRRPGAAAGSLSLAGAGLVPCGAGGSSS
jgi:hypothetical protein